MPRDLSVRCSCGALRGVVRGVTGDSGNRVICYCDDCQSFAHFLGHPDQTLDTHGGTDIFQMSPAHLKITQGAERLACMRLTPGGLLRWYADCCKTPVGNTPASRHVPFVGLIHTFNDHASDGGSRGEALGPVRARVQARFAKGDRDALDANDRAPLSLIFRFARMVLMARLRGEHARSPFSDDQTRVPIARPRVLTTEELCLVETARDATETDAG